MMRRVKAKHRNSKVLWEKEELKGEGSIGNMIKMSHMMWSGLSRTGSMFSRSSSQL
jgi:hypothetical protein